MHVNLHFISYLLNIVYVFYMCSLLLCKGTNCLNEIKKINQCHDPKIDGMVTRVLDDLTIDICK